MAASPQYAQRRGELETYFDRTASAAWAALTSDAPVSRIRATVRAGRDAMRETLLSWLPQDLRGARLLDAGCGTGAFAIEAARRGADVTAIDIAPALIAIAEQRMPAELSHKARFLAGDMLDASLGRFDIVVAMDSLIHYEADDIARTLGSLAQRTNSQMVATFAPRTRALTVMHTVGRIFPRGNRAPAIAPVAEDKLRALIAARSECRGWTIRRDARISHGFYTSHALEMVSR